MLVFAGPPGSGKSTFFPVAALGVDAFSIDDRCAQIVGSYRAIPPTVRKAVSQQCETFVAEHIDGRRSFAVETTMRTLVSVRQAERARNQWLPHGPHVLVHNLTGHQHRTCTPACPGGWTCCV
jgi:predicted ABC-type ATPase